MKVATMQCQIRRQARLLIIPSMAGKWHLDNRRSAFGVTDNDCGRRTRERQEAVPKSQCVENPNTVRPDLNASALLDELAPLLDDAAGNSAPCQRQRASKSGNTAPGDDNGLFGVR